MMLNVSLQLTPLQPNALPSCRVRASRIFQVCTMPRTLRICRSKQQIRASLMPLTALSGSLEFK